MRVLLFAPHLPLKWGAWGANIKCPSIWGAYLIADSNSLGAGANLDNCPFCHSGCQLLVQTGCRVPVQFLLSKQSLDSLVRHLCGTLGAERYIIQTLKDHFQTIYFKYNVYCSSFTKELPRLPPWKNQKWMKLCHILCHICGTCGTPIKCATLCGTCKWDPLDNCKLIVYHSW